MELTLSGDWNAFLKAIPDVKLLSSRVINAWAHEAERVAKESLTKGRSDSRYLTSRSGRYRDAIEGKALGPDTGSLSVTHPGAASNEVGAIIRPIRSRYLSFRLYQPSDTTVPTGRYIRTKMVTVPARHTIENAGTQAIGYVITHLALIAAGGIP